MSFNNRLAWIVALGFISRAGLVASHVPQTMETIVQRGVGAPDVLKLERLPVPHSGANQVLVHVYAPGGEMAGIVAAVGGSVTRWRVGEAVYGRARPGGDARYVVADSDDIAAKPKRPPPYLLLVVRSAPSGVTCAERSHRRHRVVRAAQRFVQAGQLIIRGAKTVPLAQAGQAQELDHGGHAEGKIILVTTTAAGKT